jgi:hypothetical protein
MTGDRISPPLGSQGRPRSGARLSFPTARPDDDEELSFGHIETQILNGRDLAAADCELFGEVLDGDHLLLNSKFEIRILIAATDT